MHPQSNDQITRLQQQNFHRLLSNAESANNNYLSEDDNHSDAQRTILNQRKQVLLKALQNIDKQIDELDIQ